MKAVVKAASGPGQVELRHVARPHPGEGEVLLEIGAAGICGSDLHIFADEYPYCPPVTLGHEFAGTIVEIGEGVVGWEIGDRVTSMPFAVVCGTCRHCREGDFGLCDSRLSYGSGVDGAFAEYLAVSASRLYRLPDRQDFSAGCLTEPVACATKAVFEIGEVQPGERVAVLGPGPIGLLTTQVVRAVGAQAMLVGLRSDAARLDLGQTLGANHIFYADDPGTCEQMTEVVGADGIDVVFECSGAAAALRLGLQLARKKGRIIQVGLFGKRVQVDPDLVVFKQLALRGTLMSNRKSWERALDLTGSGQVDTGCLVSNVFPLEDWEEAFARASEQSGLKVIFQP